MAGFPPRAQAGRRRCLNEIEQKPYGVPGFPGATLRELFPKKPLGESYPGFIKALMKHSPALLEAMTGHLRRHLKGMAPAHWLRQGWCAFAVDGSRVECPRTKSNQAVLRCAGKKKTGPQLFLTTILHMGTGLPWAFRIGPGTDSERNHLRDLLGLLPTLGNQGTPYGLLLYLGGRADRVRAWRDWRERLKNLNETE